MHKLAHLLLTVALANLTLLVLFAFTDSPRRVEARLASPTWQEPPFLANTLKHTPPGAVRGAVADMNRVPPSSTETYGSSSLAEGYSTNPPDDVTPSIATGSSDPMREVEQSEAALVSPGVDLSVSQAWVSGANAAGHYLTYRLSYGNKGTQNASIVVITDTLPAGMTFSYWSSSPDPYWNMTTSANAIILAATTLYAGESGTISFTAYITTGVADGTVLTNTVEIASSGADDYPSDNIAALPLTIGADYRDLVISQSIYLGTAAPGGDVEYRIIYQNSGSTAASNVVVTDTIPTGALLISAYGGITRTVSGNTVVWNIGTISPGGYQGSLYFVVHISESLAAGSSWCNQVTVAAPGPEADLADNTSSSCTLLVEPTRDAYVGKWVNSPMIGSDVTFSIAFANYGSAAMHDVVITDTLPPEYTFVGASGPFTPIVLDNLLIWSLGTVTSQSFSGYNHVNATLHVSESTLPGQLICNEVEISTSDVETGTRQNYGMDCDTAVAPTRDVSVAKNRYTGEPRVGTTLSYRLDYSNNGTGRAANVVITDTLPPGMTYDPAYANNDSYSGWTRAVTGDQVVLTKPYLNAGESGSVLVSGYISPTVLVGNVLTNTAQIATTDVETNYANNISTWADRATAAGVDMSISQLWQYGEPVAGHSLTYRVSVTNRGAVNAYGVIITNTLPPEMTFVNNGDYYYWSPTVGGNTITWTHSYPIPAGSYNYFDVTVNISSGIADGTAIANRVGVSSNSTDDNPSDNLAALTWTLSTLDRDLYVNDYFNEGYLVQGRDFVYRISYRNDGADPASDVLMTDTLPIGLSFVSATGTVMPTVSGNQLIWNIGALAQQWYTGWSGETYVTVHLGDEVPVGTRLCNLVEISGPYPDAGPDNNISTRCSTVQALTRDLSISKSVWSSSPNFPGTDIEYSIYYELSGNVAASDVMITDTLPDWMTYVSDSNSYGFTTSVMGTRIVWTKASVTPGQSGYIDLHAHVSEATPPGTQLANTISIASNELDTNPLNNIYIYTRTVTARTRDIQTSMSASGTPAAGNNIRYEIRIYNAGNSEASNVMVTNTLPAYMTFVSDATDPYYGFTQLMTGSTTVWTNSSLPAGYSRYVVLNARIADNVPFGTVLTNTAQAATSDVDINPANNAVTHTLTMLHPFKDVSVSTSLASGSATPGNNIRYAVNYSSLGSAGISNVVMTMTLPVSTTYLSYSGGLTPTVSGNKLIWNLGNLPASAYSESGNTVHVTVRLSEQVAVGTVLTNTVDVTCSDIEKDYGNNHAATVSTVSLGSANPYIYWAYNNPSTAAAGEETGYSLEYHNWSSNSSLDTVITETLPAGTSYVSSSGGPEPMVDGDQVVWILGAVPGNSSKTLYVTVTVASDVPPGTVLTSTAVISASNDSYPDNNTATQQRTVVAARRDAYVNQSLNSTVVIGRDARFSLFYGRHYWSTVSLHNVVMTDTLAPGMSFVSSTGTISPTVTGNLLVWNLGTILDDLDRSIAVTVHISDTIPPGASLCNNVAISMSEVETGPGDNSKYACATAQPQTRDVNVGGYQYYDNPLSVSSVVRYRIEYRNEGNTPAANVVITDTLPEGMTYDPAEASFDDAGWTRTTSGNQVVWTRPWLDTGEYGAVHAAGRISAMVPAAAILTNTAQIATADPETDYADNITSWGVRLPSSSGVDLRVSKTWASGERRIGQQLGYRISYENNGAETASGVVITDTLPEGMTYAYGYNYSSMGQTGNVITFGVSSVSPGYGSSVYFTVNISGTLADGTTLTNTVEIGSSTADDSPADNHVAYPLAVYSARRDLYLTPYVNQGTAVPGQDMQYVFYLHNSGGSAAANVMVTATLPPGVSFVSAVGGLARSVNGNRVVWNVGSVSDYYGGSVYVTVHVLEDQLIGSSLCIIGEISTSDPETGLESNTSTLCSTVQPPSRDVYVSQYLYAGTPRAGADIRYQISFGNQGNSAAQDVIITDTLPVSATYVSYTGNWVNPNSNAITSTVTVSGGHAVWNLGTIPGHSYGYLHPTIHISETVPAGTVITNEVSISTSDWETNSGNNRSVDVQTVLPAAPNVSVSSLLAAGSPIAGSEIVYYVRVQNPSYATDAADVTITDTLPLSVTYIHDSNDFGFTTVITGNTIVWTRPSVPSGFYGGIFLYAHIDAMVSHGTLLTNTTMVSSLGQDTNPADNVHKYVLTAVAPTRDVAVSLSAWPSTVAPASETTLQIWCTNNGNSPAENVLVTYTLPVSATFVSASWPGTQVGNKVVWNLSRLFPSNAASHSVTIRLAELAPTGTVLTSTVEVTISEVETDYSNNHSVVTQTVVAGNSDLALYKKLLSDSLPRGSTATYAITYTNQSANAALNTVLTDTLPARLTYLSSSGPVSPTVNGSNVTWNLGHIVGNTSNTIYMTVSVASNAPVGGELTNSATITATNDTAPGNNSASDTHTVAALERDAFISIVALTTSAQRYLAYEITYGNNGNVSAANVVLTDTLPPGVSFERAWRWSQLPAQLEIYTPTVITGNQLVWSLGSLASSWDEGAGGYSVLHVTVRITDSVSAETLLTNTVEIATSDAETSYTNNSASVTIPVYQTGVDLLLTKSATGSAAPGETVEYVITYTNRGGMTPPTNAIVTITDTLPVGMTYVSESHDTWTWIVTPTANMVIWSADTRYLPFTSGTVGTLRLTARVDPSVVPGTILSNTVAIGGAADIAPENNLYRSPFVVSQTTQDVYLAKRLESGALVRGEDVTYTLTYGNSGGGLATNLVVTDTLPNGTSFITSTGWNGLPLSPSSVAGNRLVWNLGNVASGWYYDLKVRVHVSDTLAAGTRLTNTAVLATSALETDYANNTAVLAGTTGSGNPVPAITSMRPVTATAGGPAFTLYVTGTQLVPGSQVRWNGTARPTTFVSSTLVTAIIPPTDITSVTTATITVFNPTPIGGESNPVTLAVEKTGTAVALTSSSNPSVLGQSVSFTATVTALLPSTLVPTGTAAFQIDGTNWVTAALANGMAATPPTSTLTLGSHSVTASYGGDANSQPSAGSLTGGQTVEQAYSRVVIASSGSPTPMFESVTFTATVSVVPPGTGTVTGTVQFKNNGVPLGPTQPLSGNVATYITSALRAGTNSVSAEYSGNTYLRPSTSLALTHQVLPAPTLVTLATGMPNPSVFGQPVLLTATLTSAAGVPTGSVTFNKVIMPLGSGTLDESGIATTTVSSLGVGTHVITATYQGVGDFAAATSNAITQTVQKANTALNITASARNPSVVGEPVAVTYTLAAVPPSTGSPAGTVRISDGTASCTATLPAVGCSLALTTTGTHNLTASYSGNTKFNATTSASVNQTVEKANTTVALGSAPAAPVFGQSVTFSATVMAVAPGAGMPTGLVTFKHEDAVLGTGTLNASGIATLITNTLPVISSPHSISAAYGGDSNWNVSPAISINQTITRANVSVFVTASPNPAPAGYPVVFTVTASAAAPGSGTPGGSVLFKIDGADWITATLVNGKAASPATSTLSTGNHTVNAVYSGNENFKPGSGSLAGGQTVGKASTTTTVQSWPNPSVWGQTVTLTATVTSFVGIPSGSVIFRDEYYELGSGTLNASGVATITTPALNVGTRWPMAEYMGSSAHNGSTGTLAGGQTVKGTITPYIMMHDPSPSYEGEPVMVSVSLGMWYGAAAPTGIITITASEPVTCTLSVYAGYGGSCALVLTEPGEKMLVASYSGDENYVGSTAPGVSHWVYNLVPSITSVSPDFSLVGGSGFTLTVNGMNFIPGSVVRWNGAARPTTFVSNLQLQAMIPATDLAGPGEVSLTVAHPGSLGDISNVVTHIVRGPSTMLYLPLIERGGGPPLVPAASTTVTPTLSAPHPSKTPTAVPKINAPGSNYYLPFVAR